MTARLPAQRPARSDYGPAYSNARPVKRPSNELDAAHFVQLADEVTQIGTVAPLAVVRLVGGVSPSVEWATGVSSALVSITRITNGQYEIVFDAETGVRINAATVTPIEYPAPPTGVGFGANTNSLLVDFDGVDVIGFCLVVY